MVEVVTTLHGGGEQGEAEFLQLFELINGFVEGDKFNEFGPPFRNAAGGGREARQFAGFAENVADTEVGTAAHDGAEIMGILHAIEINKKLWLLIGLKRLEQRRKRNLWFVTSQQADPLVMDRFGDLLQLLAGDDVIGLALCGRPFEQVGEMLYQWFFNVDPDYIPGALLPESTAGGGAVVLQFTGSGLSGGSAVYRLRSARRGFFLHRRDGGRNRNGVPLSTQAWGVASLALGDPDHFGHDVLAEW